MSGYEQLEVVSQADIRQMVDLEAEKQAMGCDTTSCLAEIAGAMGAAYVVFGRVGRLDERLFVQLNLFDSAKGRAVARQEVRAERLGEVPDVVRPALAHLVAPLTGIAPPPETPVAAAPDAGSSVLASPLLWGGAAALSVGVVSAVGLGAGTLWADGVLGQLNAPPADKNFAADVGPWLFVGAVTGGALALGGGALVGIAFVGE